MNQLVVDKPKSVLAAKRARDTKALSELGSKGGKAKKALENQRWWDRHQDLIRWVGDPANYLEECRLRDLEAHLDTHPID